MTALKQRAKIERVLCPTDLSGKSQKALGFGVRLAERLNASLTACHCVQANWFASASRLPLEEGERIRSAITVQVRDTQGPASTLTWRSMIIENSFDPARDIVSLAHEAEIDLIVMKARPSVLSAFRFGSIVERVVDGSPCPVLLLPSRYLENRDPRTDTMAFRRILFDYDFSEATDQLFHLANTLTRDYDADLRVLSVLDPSSYSATDSAAVPFSRTTVQTMVRGKLDDALHVEGRSVMDVPTSVEWGKHTETVLRYTREKNIDLICTALAPPHFYFEKLYSAYLGSLLKSAECPILVKRSAVRTAGKKNQE
jgi:nucleotide-binding universal stress UspA family protein